MGSRAQRPQMRRLLPTALRGFLASVSEAKGLSAPSRTWRSSSSNLVLSDWPGLLTFWKLGSAGAQAVDQSLAQHLCCQLFGTRCGAHAQGIGFAKIVEGGHDNGALIDRHPNDVFGNLRDEVCALHANGHQRGV